MKNKYNKKFNKMLNFFIEHKIDFSIEHKKDVSSRDYIYIYYFSRHISFQYKYVAEYYSVYIQEKDFKNENNIKTMSLYYTKFKDLKDSILFFHKWGYEKRIWKLSAIDYLNSIAYKTQRTTYYPLPSEKK